MELKGVNGALEAELVKLKSSTRHTRIRCQLSPRTHPKNSPLQHRPDLSTSLTPFTTSPTPLRTRDDS